MTNPTGENRLLRTCVVLAAVLTFSGCSQIPRHEVDISRQFREKPAGSVCIPDPFWAENVDRVWPEDFKEMLPENRAGSSALILGLVESSLTASVSIDSGCRADDRTKDWARRIAEDLVADRVPLSVPELKGSAESILIVSVVRYGIEKDQLHVRFLPFLPWMKKHYVGDPKWDHVCDLSALLIRPDDGAVLFSVREQQVLSSGKSDQELLAQAAKDAAAAVGRAFTPRE